MSKQTEKKTHCLNMESTIICGIPLSWGRPTTHKASETTCQGCIAGMHPTIRDAQFVGTETGWMPRKLHEELQAIEQGG